MSGILTSVIRSTVQSHYNRFVMLRLERGVASNANPLKPEDSAPAEKSPPDKTEKEEVSNDGNDEGNEKREMIEMWNKEAPAGPEWGGPRGYEPTRHGDWSRNGRVSDF